MSKMEESDPGYDPLRISSPGGQRGWEEEVVDRISKQVLLHLLYALNNYLELGKTLAEAQEALEISGEDSSPGGE